jgi:hypothetical protein
VGATQLAEHLRAAEGKARAAAAGRDGGRVVRVWAVLVGTALTRPDSRIGACALRRPSEPSGAARGGGCLSRCACCCSRRTSGARRPHPSLPLPSRLPRADRRAVL